MPAPRRSRAVARATAAVRRVPAAVWALQLLFVLLLVLWSQLAPVGRAPDEPGHAGLAYLLADGAAYPDYDDFHPYQGVVAAGLENVPGNPLTDAPPLTPDTATPRSERPTLEGWGGREPWPFANQISQHPPLYYELTGLGLRIGQDLAPDDQPLDREWAFMRFISVLFTAPLPLLAWATAAAIGVGRVAAVTAAAVPLATPQLAHVGSAVQNDSLLVVAAGVASVLLARVVRGDRRWVTVLGLGLAVAVALWTKAMAFALVAVLPLAFAVPAIGDRSRRKGQALAGASCLAVAFLVGGWWWVRNLVRHGSLSPSILSDGTPPEGFEPDLVDYVLDYVPTVIQRFWGSFGSFEAPVQAGLVVLATVVAVSAVAAAFARPAAPGDGPSRRQLAVLVAPVAVLVAAGFASAYRHFVTTGVAGQIQGRYFFSGLVALAPVVGAGLVVLVGRRAPLALVALALAMHLDGARAALDQFWGEPGASLRRSVASLAAWSPLPASLLAVVVVLTVGAAALAAMAVRPGAVSRALTHPRPQTNVQTHVQVDPALSDG